MKSWKLILDRSSYVAAGLGAVLRFAFQFCHCLISFQENYLREDQEIILDEYKAAKGIRLFLSTPIKFVAL